MRSLTQQLDIIKVKTCWAWCTEKGPSINDVGNFSKFLTPPSPMLTVFSTICRQFGQIFDPFQLPTSYMDGPKRLHVLFAQSSHVHIVHPVHLASTASTTYGEHSGYTYPALKKIYSIKIDSGKDLFIKNRTRTVVTLVLFWFDFL